MNIEDFINDFGPPLDIQNWLRSLKATKTTITMVEAWEQCDRGDWLLWTWRKMGHTTKADTVQLIIAFAERMLVFFERWHPSDGRPRRAIYAAEQWLREPTAENEQKALNTYVSAREAYSMAKKEAYDIYARNIEIVRDAKNQADHAEWVSHNDSARYRQLWAAPKAVALYRARDIAMEIEFALKARAARLAGQDVPSPGADAAAHAANWASLAALAAYEDDNAARAIAEDIWYKIGVYAEIKDKASFIRDLIKNPFKEKE
jgi:hypothetical protein